MSTIRFTPQTLNGLPFAEPQRDYYDATLPGFGLRIGKRSKTFFVRYRTEEGLHRRQDLGRYHDAQSLTDARTTAQTVLRKSDDGRDPAHEQQLARTQTFGALGALYLEKHAMRKDAHGRPKKRSWRDDARMIRRELAAWYQRPVKSIRRAEVRDLLDDIVARGAPVLANRVLALVRKMLNFALDREWVDANVAAKMAQPTKESARTRVLTPAELVRLWAWLERPAPATVTIGGKVVPVDATHWRLTQALLKLRLLTAQRGEELLAIRWSDLDLETGWWTIPKEIAKNGLAHRVFLTATALAILQALAPPLEPRTGIVFRGIIGPRHRRPVLIDLPIDDFQPKDLRRTATTLMRVGGVPRDTVKRILNHVERDVTAVYDRYACDPEKQAALTWWANRLDAIVQSRVAKLLPFAPLS